MEYFEAVRLITLLQDREGLKCAAHAEQSIRVMVARGCGKDLCRQDATSSPILLPLPSKISKKTHL